MEECLHSALLPVEVTIKVSKWAGDGKRQKKMQGFAFQLIRACVDNDSSATYLNVK